MKRICVMFFGALAFVLVGCSKNATPEQPSVPLENAWMSDESLPVPIQFGMSTGMGLQHTKAMINTWDDLEHSLGIFALNLDGSDGFDRGSYDVYLDNEPAECVFDESRGKDMIKFSENKYYPYASDRNLSFFGYYPYFTGNTPVYSAESIRIPIPAEEWGRQDILCASSFADTMFVKKDTDLGYFVPVEKGEATHFYNGYNATYMRFLNRNGMYEDRMPNLVFKHKTTCFVFEAYLTNVPSDKVTDFDQVPIIQSIEISGESIYEKAYLQVAKKSIDNKNEWSGELSVEGTGNGVLKLGGKNAGDLNATPDPETLKYNLSDNQFFLQPMDASEVLTIKVTLENPYNKKREVFEANFPAIPEEVERFEEGKYYPFKITINYFTGVEISTSLDPWQFGWSEDSENDNIGEDTPSGIL